MTTKALALSMNKRKESMTAAQLVRQVLSDYKRMTTFTGQEQMYE
jgi:hypothetical protein